jgi:uncharacterized protein YcbK (DUF882 family)/LysM repeat protein
LAATLLSSLGANAARDAAPRPASGSAAPAKSAASPVGKVTVANAAAAKTPAKGKAPAKAPKLETHRVFAGQTLGRIAKRYNVSIEALCYANGITRKDSIQPGQKLFVPARADKDGSEARRLVLGEPEPTTSDTVVPAPNKPSAENIAARTGGTKAEASTTTNAARFPKVAPARAALPTPGTVAKGKKGSSWAQYLKPAQKRGYVVLNATGRNWKGYAIVKGNRLSSSAQSGFNHALYSWRTGHESQISPPLIRLLADVSDKFGGRALRVVSGYREHSHAKESRHKLGHACDFTIPGVPNEALRDYLLTLDNVGVGYYPHSSFVHLDVRRIKATWVDFAGPGERPRYLHEMNKRRAQAAKQKAEADFADVPPVKPETEDDQDELETEPSAPNAKPSEPPLLAATFSEAPFEDRPVTRPAVSPARTMVPPAAQPAARPQTGAGARTPNATSQAPAASPSAAVRSGVPLVPAPVPPGSR